MPQEVSSAGEITMLLRAHRQGSREAADQLLPLVYEQLRRLAARQMSRERPGHLLQATALVHEAWLRLFDGQPREFQDRIHFYRVAGRQMRRLLVDQARREIAGRRGGAAVRVPWNEAQPAVPPVSEEVLDVHEFLTELEQLDPRAAQIVELCYFVGLTQPEAAEVLEIGETTLKRDWDFARTWLKDRIERKPR